MESWRVWVKWEGPNTLDDVERQRCEEAIQKAVEPIGRPESGMVIELFQSQLSPGGKWQVSSHPELAGQYSRAARQALRQCLPQGHEVIEPLGSV